MFMARKCYRCGKCWYPMDFKGESCRFRMPLYQSQSDISRMLIGRALIQGASTDNWIDLCPECAKKFEEFVTNSSAAHMANKEEDMDFVKLEDLPLDSDGDILTIFDPEDKKFKKLYINPKEIWLKGFHAAPLPHSVVLNAKDVRNVWDKMIASSQKYKAFSLVNLMEWLGFDSNDISASDAMGKNSVIFVREEDTKR